MSASRSSLGSSLAAYRSPTIVTETKGLPLLPFKTDTSCRIATLVAAKDHLSVADIFSKSRRKELVLARWKIWFFLYYMGYSQINIARLFNRDASTVSHGLKQMDQRVML